VAKKVTKKAQTQVTVKKAVRKRTGGNVLKKAAVVRKSVARKAKVNLAPSAPETVRPTIQKNSTWLKQDQLEHFRRLLLRKLKEINGDVDHIEAESLKASRVDASGDLSSMPIHMADLGSDNYEQEFSLGLMHSERKIVREIIAALRRIAEGTYGICEGSGEPIPLTRLSGIPWARYCVQYAEKLEKGLVPKPPSAEASSPDELEDIDRQSLASEDRLERSDRQGDDEPDDNDEPSYDSFNEQQD
jgi:RNA polymerase-binding transcription factor DksA